MGATVALGFSDPLTGDNGLARPKASLPSIARQAAPHAAPVNVVITDDQATFRAGLARLLAAETRLKVVSQTSDPTQTDLAIQAMPSLAPLPEPSVIQIVVFAADVGGSWDEASTENGRSHLGRDYTAEGIIARLLALYLAGTAVVAASRPAVSKRELMVLAQVAAGLSNKQIGRHLGISQKTVRNHLSRIFSKLGAGNRTEAVMNAMRRGLLCVCGALLANLFAS